MNLDFQKIAEEAFIDELQKIAAEFDKEAGIKEMARSGLSTAKKVLRRLKPQNLTQSLQGPASIPAIG